MMIKQSCTNIDDLCRVASLLFFLIVHALTHVLVLQFEGKEITCRFPV
jgi:hypothetical protein